MRSAYLFLILTYSVLSAHSQTVDTLPFFVPAKGIYTSYTSLRNSVPNRFDSFRIIARTKGDLMWAGGGPYEFELTADDKKEWRALRKVLVGISDGTQFYISDLYTSGGWMGISKCYLKGPFII